MKKALLKTLLLLAILGLIKLPFLLAWEDELIHRRAAFAEGGYTAVFVGSSRTKMSIVPALFDSLTRGETKTYNFGIEAGVPPYTFDWCEDLIENGESLEYIFFELSGGERIHERLKAPWREFYLKEYFAEMKKSSFAETQKYHNELVLNFFKPAVREEDADFVAYNLPLEQALVRGEIVAPRTTDLDELGFSEIRNRKAETGKLPENFTLSQAYWERICRLIELAEAKKIRLYFFIPPRLESDEELTTVMPVYRKLDEKYKIRADHFAPMLYRPETSADEFHLNHAGALRFTRNFAEIFYNKREF